MYKSPIEIITTDTVMKIVKEQEKQVFRAIQNVGINVDRDELIKALNYDRNQYQEGHKDGYTSGAKELAERLIAKCDSPYFCVWMSEIEDELKEMVGDKQ